MVILPKHFQTVAAAHYKPASDTLGECIRQASAREAEVIEGLRSIDKIAPKALTNGTRSGKKKTALCTIRVDCTSQM